MVLGDKRHKKEPKERKKYKIRSVYVYPGIFNILDIYLNGIKIKNSIVACFSVCVPVWWLTIIAQRGEKMKKMTNNDRILV